MPYPANLSGLSTREQLIDLVQRAVLAFDEYDKELFKSCWPSSEAEQEKIVVVFAGTTYNGLKELTEKSFDVVGPMDTQHFPSGFRIEVEEGASTAKIFCNALAQHFRAGEGFKPGADHFLAGTVYDIDAVKEADGQWKVKSWTLRVRWAQGNAAIMSGQ